MKIIGLTGPKGSGKDTVADILLENGVIEGKMALAHKLRMVCAQWTDSLYQDFVDPKYKDRKYDHFRPLILEDLIRLQSIINIVSPLSPIPTAKLRKYIGKTMRSPREVMQFVGTDIIRDLIDPLWHCNNLFDNEKLDGIYAITDIRFLNEYTYLKDKFGNDFKLYYIARLDIEKDEHRSESEFIKIIHGDSEFICIDNTGDLDDLTSELEHVFNFSHNRESKDGSTG